MNNFRAWVETTRAGNYIVRYYDGTRLPNGRLKQFSRDHVDKTQTALVEGDKKTGKFLAEALAKQLEADHILGKLHVVDESLQLHPFVESFLELKESQNRSWSTLKQYRQALELLLRFFPMLSDLASADKFNDWKTKLIAMKYKQNTVYNYVNIAAIFCNWLVEGKKLQTSPVGRGVVGSQAENVPKFYTTSEFMALHQSIESLSYYARLGCLLAHDYGLRLLEIVGDGKVRPSGVLWEDLIWRPDGKVDLLIRKEVTKGKKKARKIRLAPSFVELLGSRKSGPLVPLTREEFRYLFNKAREKAKLGKKHWIHGLRHSFGKNFLQRTGSNQAALRDLMGHTDVKTTEIYSQFEESYLDEHIEKMTEARRREEALLNLQGKKTSFPLELTNEQASLNINENTNRIAESI